MSTPRKAKCGRGEFAFEANSTVVMHEAQGSIKWHRRSISLAAYVYSMTRVSELEARREK